MSFRQSLNLDGNESPEPWEPMFDRHGARKFNALIKKGAAARSRKRKRPSRSHTGGSAPASRPSTQRLTNSRHPRTLQNTIKPPTFYNGQRRPDGPPAHGSRDMPRLTEVAQIQASYGERGRVTTPYHASDATQHGPGEQLLGNSTTLTLTNTSPNYNMTMEDNPVLPSMVQVPGNHQPFPPPQPSFYQSSMPLTTGVNFQLPSAPPAAHHGDLMATGPNQVTQHLSSMIDTYSPFSVISATAAFSLGAFGTLCRPGQSPYVGHAGILMPGWFIEDILVGSKLWGISNLRVRLLVVRDIGGGIDIILGARLLEMVRQQHIASNTSTN